jgi:hypothetical protein
MSAVTKRARLVVVSLKTLVSAGSLNMGLNAMFDAVDGSLLHNPTSSDFPSKLIIH